MQETKRKVITESEFLRSYLWLESVLIQTPLPFNSLPKAKYVMYRHSYKLPLYWFTTTCHNTEECIEIMKNKYKEMDYPTSYFDVYKLQDGNKELIYTNKSIDKP